MGIMRTQLIFNDHYRPTAMQSFSQGVFHVKQTTKDVAGRVFGAASHKPTCANSTLGAIENGITIPSRFVRKAIHIAEWFKKSRLWTVFAIPFNCYRMSENIRSFINGNKDEKIDASLMFSAEFSQLLFNTSMLATGLVDLKKIPKSCLKWAEPLMMFSIPFQFGLMVFKIKASRQAEQLIKRLRLNQEEWTSTDLKDLYEKLKDKSNSFFERRFNVKDGNEFRMKLETITIDLDLDHPAKRIETTNNTMKALKERLVSKKFSDKLGAVAAAVNLIATVIFVVSPFSPVGYVVFALGALMETGLYLHDYCCDYRLARKMDLSVDQFLHNRVLRCAKRAWWKLQDLQDQRFTRHQIKQVPSLTDIKISKNNLMSS